MGGWGEEKKKNITCNTRLSIDLLGVGGALDCGREVSTQTVMEGLRCSTLILIYGAAQFIGAALALGSKLGAIVILISLLVRSNFGALVEKRSFRISSAYSSSEAEIFHVSRCTNHADRVDLWKIQHNGFNRSDDVDTADNGQFNMIFYDPSPKPS